MTACQGLSTPVDTTVAMELAASLKPFRRSKASASKPSRTSVNETVPGSMIVRLARRSGVFEHDAFDHVGDVLALVGCRFERLVDRLELDELADVGLVAEQLRDRAAHDFVRFGLELVDFL